jgi:sugar phosphate isomerase/epimerase
MTDLRDRIAEAIDNTDLLATYPEDRAVMVSAVWDVVRRVLDEQGREVRAKVAAEMRRAAEGRRYYATSATTPRCAEDFRGEAAWLETAAEIAEDRPGVMCSILPTHMWSDAEDRAARGES